jgi:hypothetical protein
MRIIYHLIDDNWTIQKRIVSCMWLHGRHLGIYSSQVVLKSLFSWNISRKIFSLILENDGSNGVCVREMIVRLDKNDGLCCGGKFFHVKCAAHIINLVVERWNKYDKVNNKQNTKNCWESKEFSYIERKNRTKG